MSNEFKIGVRQYKPDQRETLNDLISKIPKRKSAKQTQLILKIKELKLRYDYEKLIEKIKLSSMDSKQKLEAVEELENAYKKMSTEAQMIDEFNNLLNE